MCTVIAVPESDLLVETQGALAELIGPAHRLVYRGIACAFCFDADLCLCQVNVEETLRRAGFRVTHDLDSRGADLVAIRIS